MGRSREPFVIALASGRSLTDAASAAGIGRTTAKRWRVEAAVQQEIAAYRQRLVDEATGRLAELAAAATAVLGAALEDATSVVRLRAAVAILDKLLALRSTVEFEQRITELERTLNELLEERARAEPWPATRRA